LSPTGLQVGGSARLLRADGSPITGLYASGGAAMGISGHGVGGYLAGNGLLPALGLAFLAAEHVAVRWGGDDSWARWRVGPLIRALVMRFLREEAGFARLCTVSRDGFPVARTVGVPVNDDWTVELVQRRIHRRLGQFQRNPRVEIIWVNSPPRSSSSVRSRRCGPQCLRRRCPSRSPVTPSMRRARVNHGDWLP